MTKRRVYQNFLMQLLFIGPALLFFLTIIIVPFLLGVFYSFTNWNGVRDTASLIGIKNYINIFSTGTYLKAFWFTVRFSFVVVILGNLSAFALAILLTSAIKFKNTFRTIFFLPNILSGYLLGFIWQFIFVKVFAGLAESTHIAFFELPWLGTEATGFWAMVIVQVWQMAGYLMVIYIAGMTNIPKSLVESTYIDGASSIQRLRYLTIPMIMPSITVSLFLSINSSFKVFDLNLSLTKGNFDTKGIAYDIFTEAFTNNAYGLGTAKSIVFCILIALITIVQTSLTKRREIEA